MIHLRNSEESTFDLSGAATKTVFFGGVCMYVYVCGRSKTNTDSQSVDTVNT